MGIKISDKDRELLKEGKLTIGELFVQSQNAKLRKIMLQDALREMEYFSERYHQLNELKAVFTAIRKVKKKIRC